MATSCASSVWTATRCTSDIFQSPVSTFSATTQDYQIGGSYFASSTLTGAVTTKSVINGTFTSSDGQSGSLSLSYDPISDGGSSLATTSSNRAATNGGVTTTLSIDSAGQLTGSDTTGCVYNGTVSIIDPTVDIYAVSVTASSCSIYNGSYTGYAVISDTTTTNDTRTYVVSNPNYVIYGDLARS